MADALLKKYYSPTPAKFRKIGDSILFLCIGIQPLTQTLPLTDTHRLWINFGFSVAGVIAKTITNFFTDDIPEQQS
jgi:hypothetical protein